MPIDWVSTKRWTIQLTSPKPFPWLPRHILRITSWSFENWRSLRADANIIKLHSKIKDKATGDDVFFHWSMGHIFFPQGYQLLSQRPIAEFNSRCSPLRSKIIYIYNNIYNIYNNIYIIYIYIYICQDGMDWLSQMINRFPALATSPRRRIWVIHSWLFPTRFCATSSMAAWGWRRWALKIWEKF